MLKSFFFIPAHSEKFINKISSIDADYFILDLEDSVPFDKKDVALNRVLNLKSKNFFIRPYFVNDLKDDINLLFKLFESGYQNIILPKSDYLIEILKKFSGNKFVLLVETATTYVNLKDIIRKYNKQVTGIALGSQDLCNDLSIAHNNNVLNMIRLELVSIAKAFNLFFIDTASMDILHDSINFKSECVNAFNFGSYGKFIIHPNQLQCLKNAKYFTDKEVSWAKQILSKIDTESANIGAVKYNDEVIEKPHLNKLLNIKKYIDEKKL